MKYLFLILILSLPFFFLLPSPALADTIHCTYSNPVTYTGASPSTTIDAFNFSESDCSITPPPPVVVNYPIASPSAFIDVASSSALAKGLGDFFYLSWFIFLFVIISIGFSIGIYIYKLGVHRNQEDVKEKELFYKKTK